MTYNSIKQVFLLIAALAITPFIFFLGKNFLLTEFFTTKYFLLAVIYCLFFICVAAFATFFSKKILVFILFCAYFSFLQFYFFNIQQFLTTYIDRATAYNVLGFIIFVKTIEGPRNTSSSQITPV